jgi:MYXO-CTERM domain-containing protein
MRPAICCGVAGVLSAVVSFAAFEPTIEVSPPQPTTADPVSITAWQWFGDPGQQRVSATYYQVGGQIDMEIVWYDLHSPGSGWAAVMTHEHGTVNVGALSQGHYQVDASMYLIPWEAGYYDWEEDRWYYDPSSRVFFDGVSTSFDVVPEPAALTLLALGVAAVIRRPRRPCRSRD